MAHKLCPLSFFAFYVNKDSAQAGGAHHCIEDSCALWDGNLEQCSLKSACDAVGMISDVYAGGEPVAPAPAKPKVVSSVLDKLREKRKNLPTATPNPPTPNPSTPTAPVTSNAVVEAAQPNNIQQVLPTDVKKEAEPQPIEDLLNPPKIPISQLPIVSVKTPEEGGK